MERVSSTTLLRNNSGELRQLIQQAGFDRARISRVAENSLRVELNEEQDILDPATIEETINKESLKSELIKLRRRLQVSPEEIGSESLESIVKINESVVKQLRGIDSGSVGFKLLSRGLELGVDVTHILKLRENSGFLEELTTEGTYQDNLKVIINTVSLMNDEIQQVDDKDIILFVGPTRAGKSTTLLFLSGTDMIKRNPDELGLEDVVADNVMTTKDINDPNQPLIGHSTIKSHTFFPYIHDKTLILERGAKLELVDFPGLLDTSGWQIRIALDIALKKLMEHAKSTRVVAILDSASFITSGGEIVRKTMEKLSQFYQDREKHTFVGITKLKTITPAYASIIEGKIGSHTEYSCVNPDDPLSREALLHSISEKPPILSLNSSVISPEDRMAFRGLLQGKKTVESIVGSAIRINECDKKTPNSTNEEAEFKNHLESLRKLSKWLSDETKPYLLDEIDPLFRDLSSLNDSALKLEILDLERLIALEIFKAGVSNFYEYWKILEEGYKGGELQITSSDWSRIESKLNGIKDKISPYLELKNVTINDCKPQGFWQVLYRFVTNPRVLINILGLIGQLTQRKSKIKARSVIEHITELISNYTDAIVEEDSPAFKLTISTLRVAEDLIDASFKRGIMIDEFSNRLRLGGINVQPSNKYS